VPLGFGRVRREDVEVAGRLLVTKTAVLIPPGLANHELKSLRLERWDVAALVT
jgi:hypothetical protein